MGQVLGGAMGKVSTNYVNNEIQQTQPSALNPGRPVTHLSEPPVANSRSPDMNVHERGVCESSKH